MQEITRRLFTVDEYYRMAGAGILTPEDRVELIDGEVIQMSAIGHRHMGCVTRAATLFILAFGSKAVVSTQSPVQLSDWTEPQPDLVILKPRSDFYDTRKPKPEDVLFAVEVADTSFFYDLNVKLPRFAAAGIPEVWIADLQNDVVLVFRHPLVDRYKTTTTLQRGDTVSPMAFPGITFGIDDLLGTPQTA